MSIRKYRRDRIAKLRELPVLAACTDVELEAVDSLVSHVMISAGRVFARQGEAGRECYLIESGRVAIVRDGETICEVGPGTWLGEMSLLHGEARNASLVALTDVGIDVLNRGEFTNLLDCAPALAQKIRQTATERRSQDDLVA